MRGHALDVPESHRAGSPEEHPRQPDAPGRPDGLRVVITAANCSLQMGGEAAIPFHYFRLLRARGVDVHLVAQARNREELERAFPADRDRLHLVRDDLVQRLLWQIGQWLPNRVYRGTVGFVALMLVQARQRSLIRGLVRERGIDVVHQPFPVSPAEPSIIDGVGAPVVIGPLNGGMDYPSAFRARERRTERAVVHLGRQLRNVINRLLPGKLNARILLVANPRSVRQLPDGLQGEVLELPENGVDLELWRSPARPGEAPDGIVRFVYVGRLVDWKGVDLLLEAWAQVHTKIPARLLLIGSGPMRRPLERLRDRLGLSDTVEFAGFRPAAECARCLREADVLVLPSLIECGGAVVLEAMAAGLPVIATDWGGPSDYADSSCGILVPPAGPEAFVAGLARAMERLGRSPELRLAMGEAAVGRATLFSWDAKIDRILEIYRRATRPVDDARPGDVPGPDPADGARRLSPCPGKG